MTAIQMHVPFTQFLRPNGRQVEVTYPTTSEEVYSKAKAVLAAGARFTAEVLMSGHVSLACEATFQDSEEYGDVACEVCMNGPGVGPATDRLIQSAYDYVVLRKEPALSANG